MVNDYLSQQLLITGHGKVGNVHIDSRVPIELFFPVIIPFRSDRDVHAAREVLRDCIDFLALYEVR